MATSITAAWTYRDRRGRLLGARAHPRARWSRRSPRTTAARCSTRSTRWARRRWPPAPTSPTITLTLPNRHHLLVDLTPFGLDNPNEIFVATDQPFGLIEATISVAREACATIVTRPTLRAEPERDHGRRSVDDVHRRALREPVPAVVGAADRVGVEHPARVRGRLGRRRHQDHRPASGGQRARARRPSSCAPTPTRRTCR